MRFFKCTWTIICSQEILGSFVVLVLVWDFVGLFETGFFCITQATMELDLLSAGIYRCATTPVCFVLPFLL